MSNILILGSGAMGTAFSVPCSDNNHNVTVIGTYLEDNFIDEINLTKKHPSLGLKVLPNVKFLKFEKFKEEINKKVDLIVIAVISKGIEWISNELNKGLKKNVPILILTKGLGMHNNKYEILAHKMQRLLNNNSINKLNITAAGGPCLARGLANRINTSVVFANTDIKTAKKIAELVSTDYYHISVSHDVIGVETCAAIKNIFSMAVGAAQGLCGDNLSNSTKEKNYLNTAAALIQESIYEMIIFVEKLNGKKETVMGLAGIGDLYVSADGGRNSKMGEYLGQGMTFKDAKKLKMPNETVEGCDLAIEIGKNVKEDFSLNSLPLMISIIDTICEEKTLRLDWKNFK